MVGAGRSLSLNTLRAAPFDESPVNRNLNFFLGFKMILQPQFPVYIMDRAQDSSSSKQSPVVYDNKEVSVPIQMSTVITLTEIFGKELPLTNIEQLREALKKDLAFSGFIKNQDGTQLLTDLVITRNPTHKNVVEELNEEPFMIKPDESENKDETIIDKHAELGGEKSTDVGAEGMIVDSENEDTTSIDETSDDDGETDVDKAGETDADKVGETHIDKARHFYDPHVFLRSWSPIQRYTDSKESVSCIAESVANDKDLVALGVELLKPFQEDFELTSFNAHQYCETVKHFWESENLLKAIRDDLLEYDDLAVELSHYAERYDVEEAPEDRIARIKRNPFFERLYLEGDDPVGILRAALTILVGYWTGYDLLQKLGKRLDAPDLKSRARVEIYAWLACGQRPDYGTFLKIIRNQV